MPRALGFEKLRTDSDFSYVVVVAGAHESFGFEVDDMPFEVDLVVRPLHPLLGKVQCVSATSIAEDGAPVLILDIDDIILSAKKVLESSESVDNATGVSEKSAAKKIFIAYAVGAAAVLAFLTVFYAVFSDIAILQQNALAHLSKYALSFTSLGRIDLLFVFALTLVLLFALCIPLQLSTHCAAHALSCKPLYPALAVNFLMLLFTVLFHPAYLKIQTLMTQKLWYVFAFFAVLLPVCTVLLTKKRHKKIRRPDHEK